MKPDTQLLEFTKIMQSNATDTENLMRKVLRAKRFMSFKINL